MEKQLESGFEDRLIHILQVFQDQLLLEKSTAIDQEQDHITVALNDIFLIVEGEVKLMKEEKDKEIAELKRDYSHNMEKLKETLELVKIQKKHKVEALKKEHQEKLDHLITKKAAQIKYYRRRFAKEQKKLQARYLRTIDLIDEDMAVQKKDYRRLETRHKKMELEYERQNQVVRESCEKALKIYDDHMQMSADYEEKEKKIKIKLAKQKAERALYERSEEDLAAFNIMANQFLEMSF